MAGDIHSIPELDRKGFRDFGLVTGGIVAVLFGLFFPWVFDAEFPSGFPRWPWILFAVLGTWGLVAPMSLAPVYKIWMRFGLLMSKVMTPLVLGIVFYSMFAPMGFVMRICGKDSMKRKFSDSATSYRVASRKAPVKNLEKPF
ncbi:MAG: SxtJ family membrane protein [Gammaproteobacteria bacterium]